MYFRKCITIRLIYIVYELMLQSLHVSIVLTCSQNLLTFGHFQVRLNDCHPRTGLVRSKERWVGGGRGLQVVMVCYLAQERRKKHLLHHARRRKRKLTLGRCLSIYPSVCVSSVSSGSSMPFICAHPWPGGS